MNLYEAILDLKNTHECECFLKDLCTPKELQDFNDRWEIAKLLEGGDLSYREIAEQTKTSLTTITRVARFLKDEQNFGYKTLLDRMKK